MTPNPDLLNHFPADFDFNVKGDEVTAKPLETERFKKNPRRYSITAINELRAIVGHFNNVYCLAVALNEDETIREQLQASDPTFVDNVISAGKVLIDTEVEIAKMHKAALKLKNFGDVYSNGTVQQIIMACSDLTDELLANQPILLPIEHKLRQLNGAVV